MFEGSFLRLFWVKLRNWSWVSPLNAPSCISDILLRFRYSFLHLVKGLKIPAESFLRWLASRSSSCRLISPVNAPSCILDIPLYARFSLVQLVNKLNTPDGRLLISLDSRLTSVHSGGMSEGTTSTTVSGDHDTQEGDRFSWVPETKVNCSTATETKNM